ncbi:HupE/UreJ family protein [Stigmatella sp. ncwal1]|uniref:HupE/UreJ family protein n=1 Tax=Stigmatella ashevillensis TaxID=2995309 RepID=A0ABT5D9V4_9BACT|nr:HupE/UreJ family protein [Stigmatella ashevillena]MDC0710404.1 HupE/UreJ family protein [Stigmatella ashevillena]
MTVLRRRVAVAVVLALAWTFGIADVSAHPTPGSVAFVDLTVDGARIEQDVPIEELERALKQKLWVDGESAADVVRRHSGLLRAYAGEHLRVTAVGGAQPWEVDVVEITGHASDDGPRALFRFEVRAPPGEASASVHLHDDIVAHEVVTHYTTVYLRSEWAAGALSGPPQLVGTIHAGRNDVLITRDGSFWRGFRGVVAMGIEHIATGTDHLMFLFALLLAAPMTAHRGRWSARRETRDTLVTLARIVSAFTFGHSATLALSVLGGVALPVTFVEAAIAASILMTALHAFRPIFPRHEATVACVFGLVHGLAFATALTPRDAGRWQAAWTLLGFNTGIELAQLVLLALVAPWLLLLARTRAYQAFRVGGSLTAGVLASGWLIERTVGIPNPTGLALMWIEHHPVLLLLALAFSAIVARASEPVPVPAHDE